MESKLASLGWMVNDISFQLFNPKYVSIFFCCQHKMPVVSRGHPHIEKGYKFKRLQDNHFTEYCTLKNIGLAIVAVLTGLLAISRILKTSLFYKWQYFSHTLSAGVCALFLICCSHLYYKAWIFSAPGTKGFTWRKQALWHDRTCLRIMVISFFLPFCLLFSHLHVQKRLSVVVPFLLR